MCHTFYDFVTHVLFNLCFLLILKVWDVWIPQRRNSSHTTVFRKKNSSFLSQMPIYAAFHGFFRNWQNWYGVQTSQISIAMLSSMCYHCFLPPVWGERSCQKTLPIYIVLIIGSQSNSFGKFRTMLGVSGTALDRRHDSTDCTFPCDEQMIVILQSLKGHGCHLNKEIKKHIFSWETM